MAISNDNMKAGRFLRWAKARAKVAKIKAHLAAGGRVAIGTMTKVTVLDDRHIGMVRAAKNGAFMQRGKNWDCIDFCNVRFSHG